MPKILLVAAFILLVVTVGFWIMHKDFSSQKQKAEDATKIDQATLLKPSFSTVLADKKNKQEKISHFSKYLSHEFQAGMNILLYGAPNFQAAEKTFERLKQLGFNSLAFNFPLYQSSLTANEVSRHPIETPSIEDLHQLINMAHAKGFAVMLRPIIDEAAFMDDQKWRGQIQPERPDIWFQHYEKLLMDYALLAQRTKAEFLNIGTELNRLEEAHSDRWINLITKLRAVYEGQLMYSFNWDKVEKISSVDFIESLDMIGLDAYFPLAQAADARVEDLEQAWHEKILAFKNTLPNQPLVITEVGILPVRGAYHTPYAWELPNRKYDRKIQINYYEATYKAWQPLSQGLYWWTVLLEEEKKVSYSPLYSATEEVLKKQNLPSGIDRFDE